MCPFRSSAEFCFTRPEEEPAREPTREGTATEESSDRATSYLSSHSQSGGSMLNTQSIQQGPEELQVGGGTELRKAASNGNVVEFKHKP